MIYLIDDKDKRQEEYGWTKQIFKTLEKNITPLYGINDINKVEDELYQNENVILYHESFLDFTQSKDKAVEQRKRLLKEAQTNPDLTVAFFSGSQSSRSVEKNTAYLPVSVLYENLHSFVEHNENKDESLKYLLYGEDPDIEEYLEERLIEALDKVESTHAEIEGNNLFIRPDEDYIQNAISDADVKVIIGESDDDLTNYISDWLNEEEYENIFIPLCFGYSFSDYNGLRFATHIRCTQSKNQIQRLFIYGFVEIENLINHNCFDILKTKNISYLPFSKIAFEKVARKPYVSLKQIDLSTELSKLNLSVPKNYDNNHSIKNEWAIYQWSKTIGCDITVELAKVFENIESNLYFKYLKTINPISEHQVIRKNRLKIGFNGNKPRVLLIDDESEKGWSEIFAHLLGDVNNIYVDDIGSGFRNMNQDYIISTSLDKIKTENIDIVILDFRLNKDDFNQNNIKEITGLKLLNKIKEYNPGIQVVTLSASDKLRNLQALQDAGVDGFVSKGSIQQNGEQDTIAESINEFIKLIKDLSEMRFLKSFYETLFQINQNVLRCDYADDTEFHSFIKSIETQIKVVELLGRQIKPKQSKTLDVVFLSCYNILELFKNYYLKEFNNHFVLGIEEIELNRYRYQFSSNQIDNDGVFQRISQRDSPSWFQSMMGLLIDYFEVIDSNDTIVKDVWRIKDWRNNYIHSAKTIFKKSEVLSIVALINKITESMKE
jgi:DNA-binding NarL/FixJ family response regulator